MANNKAKEIGKDVAKQVLNGRKDQFSIFLKNIIDRDGKDIVSGIANDVVMPYVKQCIYDVILGGCDYVFSGIKKQVSDFIYPDGKKVRPLNNYDNPSYKNNYISYSSIQKNNGLPETSITRSPFKDDYYFTNRGDAEWVLEEMRKCIRTNGYVTVAKYYSLTNQKTTNFLLNDMGWLDLSDASVIQNRNGYKISFKEPKDLKE